MECLEEQLIQTLFLQSSKSKGALNGRQKKSIFAVPESLSGRVRNTFSIKSLFIR